MWVAGDIWCFVKLTLHCVFVEPPSLLILYSGRCAAGIHWIKDSWCSFVNLIGGTALQWCVSDKQKQKERDNVPTLLACVFQSSWRNLADSIFSKEIIDSTAKLVGISEHMEGWRVAESISSHDKAGNSWALQEGLGIHCTILIKIIAPIHLSSSKNPLTAVLSGKMFINTFLTIFIFIWRVFLSCYSKLHDTKIHVARCLTNCLYFG